jgi:drug/metabolite transporter (DMT)-like permease
VSGGAGPTAAQRLRVWQARAADVQTRMRRRRSTRLLLTFLITLVGVSLLAAGAAMLVLPGPGIAALLLGLVVLATEFAWAERMLTQARARVESGSNAVMSRVRRPSA